MNTREQQGRTPHGWPAWIVRRSATRSGPWFHRRLLDSPRDSGVVSICCSTGIAWLRECPTKTDSLAGDKRRSRDGHHSGRTGTAGDGTRSHFQSYAFDMNSTNALSSTTNLAPLIAGSIAEEKKRDQTSTKAEIHFSGIKISLGR